jgi:hypothetical protein
LQETAAAAAAVVVGHVGGHVNKVFFPNHGFDHKTKILGAFITEAFADDVAGILDGELDLEVFVPVGVNLEFPLPDPFGVPAIDADDVNLVRQFEFLLSEPDSEGDVASLGVKKFFTPQLHCLIQGRLG